MSLDACLGLLRCPQCGRDLTRDGSAVRCEGGHAFDVARQGYLNLLPGGAQAGTADTAAMVAARDAFLGRGHYDALSAALAAAVGTGPVLDLGAGTGHHTARVLEATGTTGLALDVSKHAARRAARAHPRLGSVVADAWAALPVRDAVVGTVLSVFAPRSPAEVARVLAPGGCLVLATPTERHLRELVESLGLLTVDPRKAERLATQLAAYALVDRVLVEHPLELSAQDVRDVVAMGPSAHHSVTVPDAGATTRLSVEVAVHQPHHH